MFCLVLWGEWIFDSSSCSLVVAHFYNVNAVAGDDGSKMKMQKKKISIKFHLIKKLHDNDD